MCEKHAERNAESAKKKKHTCNKCSWNKVSCALYYCHGIEKISTQTAYHNSIVHSYTYSMCPTRL